VLLILKFIELLSKKGSSQLLRGLIHKLYRKKLEMLIEYFIEFDLDSKGITNLAFYSEEEFIECRKKRAY
jgi:hypothetical protein